MTRKMRPFVVLLPRLCSKKPGGKVGQYCRSIKQNEAIKYNLDKLGALLKMMAVQLRDCPQFGLMCSIQKSTKWFAKHS